MDLQENDIMSYYEPLVSTIKQFRGSDAYIVDIIRKVSALPVKINSNIRLERVTDVIKLLSAIRLNKI